MFEPINILSPTVMKKKLQTDCHQNDDVLEYGDAGICHQNDDVLEYGDAGIREVGPRMELIL